MSKIDFLKEALKNKGYSFINNGDFNVEIQFPKCKVIIWETIQDTLYFKIIDYNGNKIFKSTYKTVNNLFRYGFKNIID